MLSKLDVLVRYWQLIARHGRETERRSGRVKPGLGRTENVEPLDLAERTELLGLMQMVGDVDVPPPISVSQTADAHPAQLIGEGTIRTVELRAMSTGALLIATPLPPSVGARVVLRVADAVAGVEYVVPCRVAWVQAGAPASAALAIDGAPTRMDFDGLAQGPRDGFSFGDRPTPLVG